MEYQYRRLPNMADGTERLTAPKRGTPLDLAKWDLRRAKRQDGPYADPTKRNGERADRKEEEKDLINKYE